MLEDFNAPEGIIFVVLVVWVVFIVFGGIVVVVNGAVDWVEVEVVELCAATIPKLPTREKSIKNIRNLFIFVTSINIYHLAL